MTTPPNARSRAQSHFKASEQREDALRAEMEKARSATDAKTARLKALRLAKEAADKASAGAEPPRAAARKPKRAALKPAG